MKKRDSPAEQADLLLRAGTGLSLSRVAHLRRRKGVQNALTLSLVVLGPVLAGLTFIVLGPLDQGASALGLRLTLLADLVYVLLIAALVMQRVARMIAARRAKSAGSRLHLRLTGVFALLALIPTILVAVFATLSINIGLEGWFSDRVRNVLATSLRAAQAYEEEHRSELQRDGLALAAYLNTERQATFFMSDGEVRQALGRVQAQIERGLSEVFVLDGAGEITARGTRSYLFDYEPVTTAEIDTALREGILIIEDWENNEFRALIPLETFVDRFLFVSREVDGEILSLLDDTRETVGLYEQLEADRGRLLFEFGLLYLGFAAILILAAIWLGLWFAERLSRPVGRLVTASQQVGAGDLNVRLIKDDGEYEISLLGKNFNDMTAQLREQRDRLVENSRQIERRGRLFDSVLSSITSGVVGLDASGDIAFVNKSATRLLDIAKDDHGTHALSVAVPEFGPLFDRLRAEGREVVQDQINLVRNGQQESLLVRLSTRRGDDAKLEGYVVAFDDITNLVSAQRLAAWGDVARRIAHEIKNPLTPIQLSAERIKRKFTPTLGDDGADLAQMTDVIVRQTNDLRRIVDEFSRFARMPEPDRIRNNLRAVLADVLSLQEAGQPDVAFTVVLPDAEIEADIDATMITQAFTNLLKNAGEAIETRVEKSVALPVDPQIRVSLTVDGATARIEIEDNGIGLPEDRAKLFEPYVTTRDKGTGLGLPIVKKIIEEHGGTLVLETAEAFDGTGHAGARVVVIFPVLEAAANSGTGSEEKG